MIQYNFDRVFKARGIDKPFTFLVRAGFSRPFASKINNNKVKSLDFAVLERLCLVLNCPPINAPQFPSQEGNGAG